jgi:hypothetical protein
MPQRSKISILSSALILLGSFAACTGGGSGEDAPKAAAPAAAEEKVMTIAIEIADEISIGALQVDFDYSTSEGAFVGDADAVECETVLDGALSSYNNKTDERVLKAAYVAVNGIAGPVRIAECKWKGPFDPARMVVEVRDASAPDLTDIAPPPQLRIVLED